MLTVLVNGLKWKINVRYAKGLQINIYEYIFILLFITKLLINHIIQFLNNIFIKGFNANKFIIF